MTQDRHAVVDDRQSPPRDLCDMAGAAAEISVDVEWAGKYLGDAFESGDRDLPRAAMSWLYQAQASLNALIGELEQHFAEPMTEGGE